MKVTLLKDGKWRDKHYLKNEVRRAWQRYVMLSSRWGKPIDPELEAVKDELLITIGCDDYLNSYPEDMQKRIESISYALPYISPGRCKK